MIPRVAAAVAVAAALALAVTVRPPRALPAFSPAAIPTGVISSGVIPSGVIPRGVIPSVAPGTGAKSRDRRHHARGHKPVAHGKGRTRHPIHPIDVNVADVEQLAAVPGIGDDLARRIVTYRALLGHFDSLDDLSDLDGLSEGRLIALGRYLIVR